MLPRSLLGELLGRDEVEVKAVVEVVAVVGDLVGEIGDLRFERRHGVALAAWLRRIVKARMLLQAFEHFKGKIQPREPRVNLLDRLHDAQALAVVIEAAVPLHQRIEQLLAAVAHGRVPEVVRERDGLGQVFIQPEGAGDRAADRGDLHGVGEPGAQMVAGAIQKDLRLVLEPPEGS